MKSSRPNVKRRTAYFAPELLETRQMLTGGVGSTFAIIPGTITKTDGQVSVSFNLNPAYFTDKGNKPFVLGLDVAAGTNSTVNPVIESVTSPTGQTLGVTHATYDPAVKRNGVEANNKQSTAVLVTIPGLPKAGSSYTYKVNVGAIGQTSGQALVGFFIPGDADGIGTVDASDLNAIKYAIGSNAAQTNGKYAFDADANRDGQVNAKDMAIAMKDTGFSTTVSPVISANVAPAEMVDPTNRITNKNTVAISGSTTPNAAISYSETGEIPVTTTADKSGNYTITIPLLTGANTYNITTTDAFGQVITGSINSITYTPGAVAPTTPTTASATATTTTAAATQAAD